MTEYLVYWSLRRGNRIAATDNEFYQNRIFRRASQIFFVSQIKWNFSHKSYFRIFTESWIELTNNLIQSCPDRVTPPLPFSSGEEYLRLLKEAQKESNPSSLISSRRDSPKQGSPKSPPNSPNPEPSLNDEELRGVFINYYAAKVSSMFAQSWVVELIRRVQLRRWIHAKRIFGHAR